jgi:hypothetical protein
MFSRSLATLSAIFTLATGVVSTAAPSKARAEMRPQIVASEGSFIAEPDMSEGFIMGDGRICNPRWGC